MSRRLGIEAMRNLAVLRGGSCLSKKYVNIYTKLEWKCMYGHIFEATPSGVNRNIWCTTCRYSVGENITRCFFEELFDKKFISSRPKWLRGPKGKLLELDGYNKELRLAFEYNGVQHYKIAGRYKYGIEKTKKYDKIKIKKCKERNINLIVVPYTIKYEDIKDYILNYCDKNNISVPFRDKKLEYKEFNIYKNFHLDEAKKLALDNNGKCLSKIYVNAITKLRWQCKKNHIWEATLGTINSGHWCPFCAGNNKKTIYNMQILAEQKNGKCLSKKCLGMHNKIIWQCKKGHIWKTTPHHIIHGNWCPVCGGTASKERVKNILAGGESK